MYENYVIALALEGVCPKMHVDRAFMAVAFTVANVKPNDREPGGRDYAMFTRIVNEQAPKMRSLNQTSACDMADMLFGPSGSGVPGLMKTN